VGEPGELDDSEEKQEEKRCDQGELDQARATLISPISIEHPFPQWNRPACPCNR
jgi:hypothetical protein